MRRAAMAWQHDARNSLQADLAKQSDAFSRDLAQNQEITKASQQDAWLQARASAAQELAQAEAQTAQRAQSALEGMQAQLKS